MKYFILVPDGAGDEPIEALDGRTPLEVSDMPMTKELAERGSVGMVKTIPDGIPPGSDAANLSVMGYDPSIFLTGRSPLEAASIGIDMKDDDIAYRTNIVSLQGEGDYEELTIIDHSSGDISTEEADRLIQLANQAFGNDRIHFYTGVSYRHCMIEAKGSPDHDLTPPHDILGKKIGDYLPKGENSAFILDMMKKSYDLFKDHPVNKARVEKGLNPANTLWIWGQGTKPRLSPFIEKYGITGAAISAVDLIKGIAINAGLEPIEVEGATGTLNTNFEGKAQAAIEAFERGLDFVYVHLEGPDECSHQGDMEGKIQCLEDIDKRVLRPVVQYLRESGEDFRILVVPDHRTPLAIRTHSSTPVPYVLYDSRQEQEANPDHAFNEVSGSKGGYFPSGHQMADAFFERTVDA